MSINFSDLEKFAKEFDQNIDEFYNERKKVVSNIGKKAMKSVKLKTPVDSGVLRRSWKGKQEELQYTLSNSVEYAPHVEYGHRTRGKGRIIDGKYMLTKTINEIEEEFFGEIETIIENLWK